MQIERRGSRRRGYTVRDLAVGMVCLVLAAGLLTSTLGAKRNLSRAQVCANNLRQMFTGLTAYVNQYNSYPPESPWPTYSPSQYIGGGVTTGGWDPSIGWILTNGMGLEPPARDTQTGHFKWYVLTIDEVPEVCVCPAMSSNLLVAGPEIADPYYDNLTPLETYLYQYALSYQTSGTCRAATPVVIPARPGQPSQGGRNQPVPDPTGGNSTAQQASNMQRFGPPYVWIYQKKPGTAPDDPTDSGMEYGCWIQAVHPSEVDNPGRVYYMADSRDFRPVPIGQTYSKYAPAGTYRGWQNGWGNKVFLSTRHFQYSNVLYLDGRVSRDDQMHDIHWNWGYDSLTGQGNSPQWRCGTFDTNVRLTHISTQAHIMPQLNVKGWEHFFTEGGVRPH